MKYSFIFGILISCLAVQAQQVQLQQGSLAPAGRLNLSDKSIQDWNPRLQTVHEQPNHSGDLKAKKAILTRKRKMRAATGRSDQPRSLPPVPVIADTFAGNAAQSLTPPDNTIAISNAGIIVSCVNTQMMILDSTGNIIRAGSLASFANQLGVYSSISDPKVIYDPEADRFIVLFFSGANSYNTHIIVAFSETNDPTTYWSFYDLPGNLLNDTTWSDFPVVSLTHDDLFVTFNHLANDSFFPAGFKYSVIWQVDKQSGYNADTIRYNYWHHVSYQGRPIWNICTVQGGSALTGPDAYFLSLRPHDLSNDTFFLHHISNSWRSGTAQYSVQALTAPLPYGLPPDAPQVDGQQLATNDTRILSAMIENDRIQFVSNSIDPAYTSAAVYTGFISNASTAPVLSAGILGFDSIDLGYPSICYIGNGSSDNRSLITCSYLPAHGFPGTAAFYLDNAGNPSPMLMVKQGASPVDMETDSTERWGDYTTIQKKYNVPNHAWLCGSFTNRTKQYETWIACLGNLDTTALGLPVMTAFSGQVVYPNPAAEQFNLSFEQVQTSRCRFSLTDASGKMVQLLLDEQVEAGPNQFSFSTAFLSDGIYYLHISSGDKDLLTKPVVVAHRD